VSEAPRTILLIGANGQVGWELQRSLGTLGKIIAHDRSTLDLADLAAVQRAIAAASPDAIVNAAAYTAVDRAESEAALAQRINAEVPAAIAAAAKACGAVMIHYSTDYVFDGTATMPYRERDATNPQNVYGRTKRDGDVAIMQSGANAYLFRVSWVYGRRGANFLRTVQRLITEGKPLRIVADQFGAPTWSRAIADATATALDRIFRDPPEPGIYHMAAPDHTTWHGFAEAIAGAGAAMGTGARSAPGSATTGAVPGPVSIQAISTADYPTLARRPHWSVLDSSLLRSTFGIELAPWREQLAACLAEAPAVVA